jgi:hypothetical protein
MKPLPEEGGYYKEIYRSEEKIPNSVLPNRYSSNRNCCTSIFFLLKKGIFSAIHRLKSDEIYHFYTGSPITTLLLFPDLSSKVVTLGNNIQKGEIPQLVIPKGTWQGSCIKNENPDFALLGCTVSPGFEFEDFETASRNRLIEKYPDQEKFITKLTKI